MVSVLHNFRVRLESRSLGLPHVIAIVIAAFTAMGLLLAVLHGIEAAFWAAVYLWLGALDSPGAAILYSVDAMATRGASGLMLQPHWQMMGALEAADGHGSGNWARFEVPSRDCPRISAAWLEERRREDPLKFAREYECKWSAGEDCLFSDALLDRMTHDYELFPAF